MHTDVCHIWKHTAHLAWSMQDRFVVRLIILVLPRHFFWPFHFKHFFYVHQRLNLTDNYLDLFWCVSGFTFTPYGSAVLRFRQTQAECFQQWWLSDTESDTGWHGGMKLGCCSCMEGAGTCGGCYRGDMHYLRKRKSLVKITLNVLSKCASAVQISSSWTWLYLFVSS